MFYLTYFLLENYFCLAVGQALTLAMDIIKFPKGAVLTDRAVLYKHVFSKIRLKNSVVDYDTEQYKEQLFEVCISIIANLEGGKTMPLKLNVASLVEYYKNFFMALKSTTTSY